MVLELEMHRIERLYRNMKEQDDLFKALLDTPVMHVDGTAARVNGCNNNVVVCSNGTATMYLAKENKGHVGINDTPVETFGGILIHDHEHVSTAMVPTTRSALKSNRPEEYFV